MKNKNESGAQKNSAQEQMQEQLCAYLLQELDAKETAHVEQRLQESEVWRAERDRLSGTIGLVQSAMKADSVLAPEGEQLSEVALQHLALVGTQAAAGHGKGASAGAVQASPMRIFVPVAATIAVALGGYWAFQKTDHMPAVNYESTANAEDTIANRSGDAATSMQDPSETASKLALESRQRERKSGDGSGEEKKPTFNIKHTGEIVVRNEELYDPSASVELADVKEKLAAIARSMPRETHLPDGQTMNRGESREKLGQVQDQAEADVMIVEESLDSGKPEAEFTRAFTSGGVAPGGSTGREAVELGAVSGGDNWLLLNETRPSLDSAAPARDPALGSRTATVSLGLDRVSLPEASKLSEPQATPKAKVPATSHGGAYHGPSDMVPPGGSGGGGGGVWTPGPSAPNKAAGPSTPGPDPANQPGAITGSVVLPEIHDLTQGLEGQAGRGLDNQGTGKSADKDLKGPSAGFFLGQGEEGMVSEEAKRAARLRQAYQVDELDSEVEPDAELLLAMAEESPEDFRARTEQLYKSESSKQANDDGAARQDSPAGVDRFQDDELVRETREQMELRLRASIAERAAKRHEQLIRSCLPKPNERPHAMYYRWWGDNPFVYTSSDNQATFAADVDTASYTLARRYLTGNNLPTREQIRTEEFVNYFAGDITPPTSDVFAVQTEMTTSPFGGSKNRYMLRVGIRGKVVPKEERPPMALAFVVDTSGSMSNGNRMDLVKHSLRLLGTELDGRDQVGVVSFASEARLVLPMTSMDQRSELESAVQSLSPEGSTNVEDGIRLGYELLSRVPADGRLRRVVLISDGVANTGNTVADEILKSVQMHRENGIYLSTVGVGMGNHNDALLERLANRGDGICDYVDDADAARRAMVERFSGGFIPIARDLKIQLEFDGKHVLRYRQLGYENRAVADADFRNDAVDGGEVGSGHQVTALFELECVDLPDGGEWTMNDLGKVRLRYKSIATGSDQQVYETEHGMKVKAGPVPFDAGSPGFARSVVAAQFAEVLRRSTHAAGDDFAQLLAQATRVADLPAFAGDGETQELVGMIRRAGQLGAGAPVHRDELWVTVNTYRKHRYLCGTEEEIGGKPTSERLMEIAAINAELEDRIRELSLREALQGR